MLTIFDLEEGILYNNNFHGESVVYKREDNKLMAAMGKNWQEVTTYHSAWKYVEIPGQRNLCPNCKVSMILIQNAFQVERIQWYSGFSCPKCKKLFENKNDPHPKFHSSGKEV